MPPASDLAALRETIVRLERGCASAGQVSLPFGAPALDAALPGGGLPLGALHEISGTGPDMQAGASPALFVAGILARLTGPVLWVLERRDLFAPGLAAAGLHPDRVVYAEAGSRHALLVMEEGLRHRGLGAVVGETAGRLTLAHSRRLQLAAESAGIPALLIRRPKAGAADLAGAVAAVTRWRIGTLPSPPPIPDAPDVPGLGRARWQLALQRCRGGRTGAWIVEACDAQGRLSLVAPLADGSLAADVGPRRAAA